MFKLLQNRLFLCIFVITLAFMSYINVLNGQFLWDDEVMVVGNGLIRSFDNFDKILTTSPFGSTLDGADFYRPLQTISYTIDYALWGLDPMGFHVTNLMLHMASCVMLILLLLRLGCSQWVTGIVASVFAVHPLNIEAVSYISGRGDALYILLCLTVFYLYTLVSKNRWYFGVIAILLYGLALITKENALPLGLLIGVVSVFPVFGDANRIQKIIGAALSVASIGYAGLRIFFLSSGGGNPVLSRIASADIVERIMTIPYVIVTYFRLILVPYPLHMEYHYVETQFLNPYLFLGLPLIAIAFWSLLNYSKNRLQTGFWLAWTIVCLGPVLQLIPLASTVREHWATLAQLGFWIALIQVVSDLKIDRRWATGIFIAAITVYGTLTIVRNQDWTEALRLYQHDAQFEPDSFLLHNNLGVEYFRRGQFELAQRAFEDSIRVSPNQPLGYGTALNNLGAIYENKNDLAKAEELFRQSILSSQYELAYSNLARTQINQGNSKGALKTIDDGLSQYPYNAQLKLMKVAALFGCNQHDLGEAEARTLMSMYPEMGSQINQIRSQFYQR